MATPLSPAALDSLEAYATSAIAFGDDPEDKSRVEVTARDVLALIAEVRAGREVATIVLPPIASLPPETQKRIEDMLARIRETPDHVAAVRDVDEAVSAALHGAPSEAVEHPNLPPLTYDQRVASYHAKRQREIDAMCDAPTLVPGPVGISGTQPHGRTWDVDRSARLLGEGKWEHLKLPSMSPDAEAAVSSRMVGNYGAEDAHQTLEATRDLFPPASGDPSRGG